jgi:hypothetical protein
MAETKCIQLQRNTRFDDATYWSVVGSLFLDEESAVLAP